MTYLEVLDFLYTQLPVFHREGKKAYKPGLDNVIQLCQLLGNPQKDLKCLHIAGTNGKGSSSHLMASILQEHGFKVGLYTSPHLKNFTERFKINGIEIPENWITSFVNQHQSIIQNQKASFFEWTVVMAFTYFKEQNVDYAIIETGLGGRLDSTNIIQPIATFITNISFDHQDILGDSLSKIASEKAGIIKSNIPITISEKHPETFPIFENKAREENSPICFAEDLVIIVRTKNQNADYQHFESISPNLGTLQLECPLLGNYQEKNLKGIIAWCEQIISKEIIPLESEKIGLGIKNVLQNTHLKGRFQVIQSQNPKIIADTAHNEAGIQAVLNQVANFKFENVTIIIGMVKDKDIQKILHLLPNDANYIFTQIHNPRALPSNELAELAKLTGKTGIESPDVNSALKLVRKERSQELVLILGSTYLVAEINEL